MDVNSVKLQTRCKPGLGPEQACRTHLAVEEPEESDRSQRLYNTGVQDQLVITAQVQLYAVHADTLHR